jgi:branched-chain amino acid transport system permease protein
MPIGETLRLLFGVTIDGISQGFLFAMFGLGITLVFGLGGVLNLAIGILAVMGVLLAISVLNTGVGVIGAVAVGLVATGVLAYLVDRSLLRFVYKSEGDERMMLGIFATLGLATFLQGITILRYPSTYSLPVEFPTYTVGGVFLRGSSLVVILLSLVVFVVLYLFFSRTYVGTATRTLMQDEIGALLCGIDARRLRMMVFVLSTVIAGIGAFLYSVSTSVSVTSSLQLSIYGLMVSITGGVTSLSGTVIAGIGLGIVSTYVATLLGSYWSNLSIFIVVIGVLLVRAEGIA